MGALALYFLSCCSCGTGRERKPKRDPREDIVDEAFKARVYTRDDSGRIHVQPTPGSRMVSVNGSPIAEGKGGETQPGEGLPGS